MLTGLDVWLRRQRQGRGWSKPEMARRLAEAMKAAGDPAVPPVRTIYRNILGWENAESAPGERYALYCCAVFGISPGQFGTAPPPEATAFAAQPALPGPAVPALADPRLLTTAALAYRGIYGSDPGDSAVEREVLMTAHESGDHAAEAEQPGIGDTTMEQLRADVIRLAGLTDTGAPLAVFLDARRVRDRIYRLLDRRLWPREQTDLYFLLGCLNGLMGATANYLGYPDAAEELIRAGRAYADAIDHRPLLGQLHQELSVVMYERGRFEGARDMALSGLEYLSVGPEAANLHLKHAQAAGRLGDADAARQAVREAHEARDRDPAYTDELLDMGGEYVISEATHYGLAGAALAATAGAEREAAEDLERAIGLYDEGPERGKDHWFAGKPLAAIDLAVIRLRSGALDAAAAALGPAFSLPPAQRINRVTTRLAAARAELAAPIFRSSPQARDLGERIEDFDRETVLAGLHGLHGGPG
jgi:tetratricopeptide (TPR) repeat protein